jgi:ribonucleoside-diphosphate reductase alpha chain
MPKAKPIDRLALTRAKFGAKMYGDGASDVGVMDLGARHPEHRQGYSTCPSCGQETLIHEDGCMHCRSCGWSACG